MGKYLPEKTHITKLNKLTETEVTELTSLTVDETASAMFKEARKSRNYNSNFAEEHQI
jgi:hypothetical protein